MLLVSDLDIHLVKFLLGFGTHPIRFGKEVAEEREMCKGFKLLVAGLRLLFNHHLTIFFILKKKLFF